MKYISFYDSKKNRRSMSLAAVNKINYICGVFNKLGIHVDVISCGMTANEKIKSTTEKLCEDTAIHYFKTVKRSKNKIKRIFDYMVQNLVLFLYLLFNVKKNEQITVYHSLGLMRCVYLAKKIKKFKIILEVEEFYNDVCLKSKFSKRFEEKFIACADKYIFPTILLNEKFNALNKPYAIIHGTYQVEEKRNVSFGDNKVHIVYAGTLDKRKGGATATTTTTMFLPENYVVHVLGFGSEVEIEEIKKLIDKINEKSKAKAVYEGVLSGEAYIEFLQKCHIGMSTQNPDADFNATSFPSKILSYMANGLRVVTVSIPAIRTSHIGNNLYYYENQSSECIAETIKEIDFNDDYDSRKIIEKLDEKFTNDLKKLLEEN